MTEPSEVIFFSVDRSSMFPFLYQITLADTEGLA